MNSPHCKSFPQLLQACYVDQLFSVQWHSLLPVRSGKKKQQISTKQCNFQTLPACQVLILKYQFSLLPKISFNLSKCWEFCFTSRQIIQVSIYMYNSHRLSWSLLDTQIKWQWLTSFLHRSSIEISQILAMGMFLHCCGSFSVTLQWVGMLNVQCICLVFYFNQQSS